MATDWAAVKEFFDIVMEVGEPVSVCVTSEIKQEVLSVVIPPSHLDRFMKNLPTFEAQVLDLSDIPEL